MKLEAERMKEFVQYFDELERLGAGHSMGDLYRKARELNLNPPEGF